MFLIVVFLILVFFNPANSKTPPNLLSKTQRNSNKHRYPGYFICYFIYLICFQMSYITMLYRWLISSSYSFLLSELFSQI